MARQIRPWLGVALCVAGVLLTPQRGMATTVRSMSWQELTMRADLVAEVECTVAGGIVAKYKVVRVWKGRENVRDEIRLQISPDEWEPQFPLALVGQRFIVAGYRTPPAIVTSFAIGSGIPLWMRQLPSDYKTALFQGMSKIVPGTEEKPQDIFRSKFESVEAFGAAVKALEEAPPEIREKLRLDSYLEQFRGVTDADAKHALEVIAGATTVSDAQSAIASLATKAADGAGRIVQAFLDEEKAAARAAAVPPATRPAVVPTAEKIDAAVRMLADPSNPRFPAAFSLAAEARPAAATDFLVAWENPRKDWTDVYQGYVMGSYFCHTCPAAGRTALFTRLMEAKDPEIRVAAAVYLTFDDPAAGTAKLKEFCKLEGDAGAWAAITLARRGDVTAMPRAMRVFDGAGAGGMAGVPHRNFQKQMMVLLSNSAAASGVPQPPDGVAEASAAARRNEMRDALPPGMLPEAGMEEGPLGISAWYKQYAERLKIVDAWAEELAVQRVD